MTSVRTSQAATGGLLALILACQVFLFIPFSLYVGNIGEFTVSFHEIAAAYWRIPGLLIGTLLLIAILVPAPRFPAFAVVLATLYVLIWVQGNLLVWEYGLFDGRDIDWTDGAWRGWVEVAIWAGAIFAAISVGQHLYGLMMRIALVLFLLQVSLFVYGWSGYSPQRSDKLAAEELDRSYESIHRFSATKNIVHVIADGFQSDIFFELVSEDAGSLGKAFDGFTFFREHMGVFPYTHMTLPAILSGSIYRNQVPVDEHLSASLGEDTILSTASDAGYEIDLVVPAGGVTHIYGRGEYDNFFQVRNQHHLSGGDVATYDAARLVDLTLFRISPHFLKRHIYNEQLWLLQSWATDQKFMNLHFFSHAVFLKRLGERMEIDRSQPVYKLIHLMLSHNPMVTTPQCTYAGRVLPTNRRNVKNQARCGLFQVIALFEKMKEKGIYEDATIILMGDHGAWVPPKRMKAVWNGDGNSGAVINPGILALSAPLLAVKRPGDAGPMRISDAPTWIVDTAPTIADAAGLPDTMNGLSAFKVPDNEPRERRFYFYPYQRSDWTAEYLSPIEEMVVTGSVFDSGSWRYNLTHYPRNRKERASSGSRLWKSVKRQ